MEDVTPSGDKGHGQWDAQQVLSFTARLKDLRGRVEETAVSVEQRRRWQSRLAAISAGASNDLDRASAQLGRLEADVERGVRR